MGAVVPRGWAESGVQSGAVPHALPKGDSRMLADGEASQDETRTQGPGQPDTRYPRIGWDEVTLRAPALVLLPDEPHAFSAEDESRFLALDIPATRPRNGHPSAVARVDGKDFSWYGARSLEAIPRVAELVASYRPREVVAR